jgi:hypothetical protein
MTTVVTWVVIIVIGFFGVVGVLNSTLGLYCFARPSDECNRAKAAWILVAGAISMALSYMLYTKLF